MKKRTTPISSYLDPRVLTEQAWSIKYLFHCQIIVVLIHNGYSCCYLVFYE